MARNQEVIENLPLNDDEAYYKNLFEQVRIILFNIMFQILCLISMVIHNVIFLNAVRNLLIKQLL